MEVRGGRDTPGHGGAPPQRAHGRGPSPLSLPAPAPQLRAHAARPARRRTRRSAGTDTFGLRQPTGEGGLVHQGPLLCEDTLVGARRAGGSVKRLLTRYDDIAIWICSSLQQESFVFVSRMFVEASVVPSLWRHGVFILAFQDGVRTVFIGSASRGHPLELRAHAFGGVGGGAAASFCPRSVAWLGRLCGVVEAVAGK